MNLTEMFYGTFTPPPVTKVRQFKVAGFAGGKCYTPPPEKTPTRRASQWMNQQEATILEVIEILKEESGLSRQELAARTKRAPSYIHSLVGVMLGRRIITRDKIKQCHIYSLRKDYAG